MTLLRASHSTRAAWPLKKTPQIKQVVEGGAPHNTTHQLGGALLYSRTAAAQLVAVQAQDTVWRIVIRGGVIAQTAAPPACLPVSLHTTPMNTPAGMAPLQGPSRCSTRRSQRPTFPCLPPSSSCSLPWLLLEPLPSLLLLRRCPTEPPLLPLPLPGNDVAVCRPGAPPPPPLLL